MVIGTPPLGIDVANNDIDIACSYDDLDRFKMDSTTQFECFKNFEIRDSTAQNEESVVVQFSALNWDIELFCQSIPTGQQWGVRYFRIEKRLLAVVPKLKATVIKLRQSGLKTEPAFAIALGLSGDPYLALLDLEHEGHDELLQLVETQPKVMENRPHSDPNTKLG